MDRWLRATWITRATSSRVPTHLLSIISDMLDLSVIDLGGRAPTSARIDVAPLILECERMVFARAKERQLQFHNEIPAQVPALIGDSGMVRQMLLNLLSNAVKYSPSGGTVTVTVSFDSEGWLCLSVRDQGPGISPADLPNVLQRFARLRSATLAQQPGLGLGLALTKSMVDLHGGKLKIESEVGHGTEVSLCFPPERTTRTTEGLACEPTSQFS